MEYLIYIIVSFITIRAIVAILNLIWLRYIVEKDINQCVNNNIKYSLLIPARDEQKNIGNILNDISKLEHKPQEVIIFNDNSTDKTKEIIESYFNSISNLIIIDNTYPSPPEGWLGKNWGCYNLAQNAKSEYLLFCDADVRLNSDYIKYISYAKSNSAHLLSLFPYQITTSYGVKLVVPIMNWILITLLPLFLVKNCSWSSFSAANGQFMLLSKESYHEIEPHKKLKHSRAEDIDMCRLYKRKGKKCITLISDTSVQCNMYTSYNAAIDGFSKNIVHFFGGSFLAASLFILLTSFSWIVLIGYNHYFIIYYFSISLIILIVCAHITYSNYCKYLINTPLRHLSMIIIYIHSIINTITKKGEWKGRKIY